MRPARLTRAQQQAMTRERLLAAAERVFARHGYGGASIDLISAEAGYSKGAIYSNFESKEAVFLELLRLYMERDMAELERIVSLAPDQLSNVTQVDHKKWKGNNWKWKHRRRHHDNDFDVGIGFGLPFFALGVGPYYDRPDCIGWWHRHYHRLHCHGQLVYDY